jgi:hypothetical protein
VLDAVPEKPKENGDKDQKPAADAEKKDAEEPKSEAADKPKDGEAEKEKAAKAISYNRLYLDLNGNGDLSDDKPVEAQAVSSNTNTGGVLMLAGSRGNYASFSFPQVDLTVDAGGTPVEYSFTLSGYSNAQPDFCYVGVRLNAAAYREGEITLEGKKHRIVLIDFNSNGRFDDQIAMATAGSGSEARVYPQQGDMLLVDPDAKNPDSPYDPAGSKFRNYITKLINVEGRLYDLKITPAGDKITLESSAVPQGKVSNPNDGYSAMIYGDQGVLKISGNKENPASVPAGEWKLLSYSIDLTPPPETEKAAEEKAKSDEGGEKATASKPLSEALKNVLGGSAAAQKVVRRTLVAGQATASYKAVKVVAGETVEMPFGPPFKPVVQAYPGQDEKQKKITQLAMSLVGSGGESCTNMIVKGVRPPKPEFTITDSEGKEVQTGSFEYG